MDTITIFTDGGSRGNPGPSAYGFVIEKNGEVIYEEGKYIGEVTNNIAEYSAMLFAFKWLYLHSDILVGITKINAFMDSLLLCQQLKGLYKVKKPHLITLMHKIREMEAKLNLSITYTHIPREKNTAADRMVNVALDNRQ